MTKKGLFIVIEGGDCTGGTTQAQLIAEKLTKSGRQVCLTQEPSVSSLGVSIRDMLKSSKVYGWEVMTHLFYADRLQHLEDVILPAIRDGKVVICDRYWYSTLVYQSALAPCEPYAVNYIRSLHRSVRQPDLTIVLDGNVEIFDERSKGRVDLEYFETIEYQKNISHKYRELKGIDIKHVDATASINDVKEQIYKLVKNLLS